MSQNEIRPRSPFNRIGPYLPTITIIGILGPAVLFIITMGLLGWRTPTIGTDGRFAFLRGSTDAVYLYEAQGTKAFFQQAGGNYETLLRPWRQFLSAKKIAHTSLNSPEALDRLKEGVLVLPSAVALSDVERASILAFRAKGGSVLATWATGTRNQAGGWVGWDFLEKLGATVVGELPADSDARQLILTGESPVSHAVPAGTRIWMSKTSEPLLRMRGEWVAGRFMSWARTPEDARAAEGAIVFSEQENTGSRAVVLGFSESNWESHPLVPHEVFADAMAWLQRNPAVVRSAWPGGKRSAHVTEMDTEQGFPNSLYFASLMKDAGLPATFYVLTSEARQFPSVLKQLARDFELGYHAEVHIGFKGQAPALQEKRIQNMIADLSAMSPDAKVADGFRAPTEGYDGNTEALLLKHGIRYHAADPERTESRLPLMAKINDLPVEQDLVVLPRTQRDDINLLAQAKTGEEVAKLMIDDFDHAYQTGAFGFLSVHTQNFGAGSPLAVAFPAYVSHLKRFSDRAWIASGSQVAQWWRDRHRFRVDSVNSGKRTEFNVTIMGEQPFKGGTVILMLPQRGLTPSIRGTKAGMVQPTLKRLDDFRYALIFESLMPGNYAYQATYN